MYILVCLMLLIQGCKDKKTAETHQSVDVNLESDSTNIKQWNTSHLFVNEISRTPEKIDLENPDDSTAIEIRAFKHQFFDGDSIKPTWVIGYVNAKTPIGKEHLPGPIIETTYGNTNVVRFTNKLRETIIENPDYPMFRYKHFDNTLDSCKWYPIIYNVKNPFHIRGLAEELYAKPSLTSGIPICKGNGDASSLPEMSSYYGTTVHLHGSNLAWRFDGYTNSSYLTPTDYSQRSAIQPDNYGMGGGLFGPYEKYQMVRNVYPNTFPESDGSAKDSLGKHGAILWYHDHAMMHTSVNVYAGLLAPYIIQGLGEYQSLSKVYINKKTERFGWDWFTHLFTDLVSEPENNDIPLVINDKSFTKNGFLYYESTADTLDSDNSTGKIQPEFFGNSIVVNGKIWPNMKVEGKTYRFRLLNTCSSRTFAFGLAKKVNGKPMPLPKALSDSIFVQIGTEGGLMPNSVPINENQRLVLAPGERADVLIDFSRFAKSDSLILMNYADNAPFGDDSSILPNITEFRNDSLTNVVMAFVLENKAENHESLEKSLEELKQNNSFKNLVAKLSTKVTDKVASSVLDGVSIYPLSLNEFTSKSSIEATNYYAILNDPKAYPIVLMNDEDWNSETRKTSNISNHRVKEVIDGEEEIWAIRNETPDTHPLHIHLNRFMILGRRSNTANANDSLTVYPNEIGWKDVVRIPTGQTTYIKVKYMLNKEKEDANTAAQFVYHCHILEHEDVSMMRRLVVKPKQVAMH